MLQFTDELRKLVDMDYRKAREYVHEVAKCAQGLAVSPLKDMYVLTAGKRNHPEQCHDPKTTCGSFLVTLQQLSVHYRDARRVHRCI